MKEYWQLYSAKVNALELRERGLLLLAAIAVVYLLWTAIVDDGQNLRKSLLEGSIQNFESENKRLLAEAQTLKALASGDPDAAHNRALAQINQQISSIDAELTNLSNGLVSAQRLPNLLQDILDQSQNLVLVQMRTLAVESIVIPQPEGVQTTRGDEVDNLLIPAQMQDNSATGVYKHAVEITLRGGYFELMRYLDSLEKLPWRFYWDWLDYDVERYPKAEMTLRVYTLTAEQGAFGV